MAAFDKLKKFADQAKEKAAPMMADAKEKAGPLATQAKEKAADLASKAAPIAAQGVDKASASIDKATKGKYSDKISDVHGKVNSGLASAADAAKSAGSDATPAQAPPIPEVVIVEPVLDKLPD
jgi:hypothetical protein